MIGRVHSIKNFGTVDSPGICMVILLGGRPVRCFYYHSPGIWDLKGGTPMTAEDILNQYEQVRPLYKKGGITVSGGEPPMQIDSVTELLEKTKKRGVHTCLDASDITLNSDSQAVMAYFGRPSASTDLILLGIRHINPEEHAKFCSQPQDNILAFAGYLEEKWIPVWIRHTVVPGVAGREEYPYRLGRYLDTPKNMEALDVLPCRDMGKARYHQPGTPYPLEDTAPLSPVKAIEARKAIPRGTRDKRTRCS